MLLPKNPGAFMDALADMLRLPDETLVMSYVYLHRYKRFQKSQTLPDPLDEYTLALASLSLSSKSTESPRRMREILFLAHRLLQRHDQSASSNPLAGPLTVPSAIYDTLRATLVQAELILLRALGFDLRVQLPLDYLARYLERAIEGVAKVGEDYDHWGTEEKEEYGVVKVITDTRIGRACKAKITNAYKNYQLAILFPPRTVALGCLYVVLQDMGLGTSDNRDRWVDDISNRKVDLEDFEEVVEVLHTG